MKTRHSTKASLLSQPSQLESTRLALPLMVSTAAHIPSHVFTTDHSVTIVGGCWCLACSNGCRQFASAAVI